MEEQVVLQVGESQPQLPEVGDVRAERSHGNNDYNDPFSRITPVLWTERVVNRAP